MRLALFITFCLSACGRPCPRRDVSTNPCVMATDCPRPATVLVCTDAEDQLRGCVGCEAQQCVRYFPQAC